MKKMCLLILFLLVLSGTASTFERKEPELPIIGETIWKIENATGWMKMPGGRWISRENRIPKYLSSDSESLQDFEENSLGVDNFYWIELRKIKIDDKEYYLLLKSLQGGYYLYPGIGKDWGYNYQIYGYVFEISEIKLEELIFDNKKPLLIKIKLKAVVEEVYHSNDFNDIYIEDIAILINERLAENKKNSERFLYINTLKLDNAIRFIMVEEYVYISGDYRSSIFLGLYESHNFPINMKDTITSEVFNNFYYEIDYNAVKDIPSKLK